MNSLLKLQVVYLIASLNLHLSLKISLYICYLFRALLMINVTLPITVFLVYLTYLIPRTLYHPLFLRRVYIFRGCMFSACRPTVRVCDQVRSQLNINQKSP